jgi:hypothetical protein
LKGIDSPARGAIVVSKIVDMLFDNAVSRATAVRDIADLN